MKKFIVLFLVAVVLFSFTSCTKEQNASPETTSAQGPIAADENLLTVTVTLAPNLFQGKTEEEIIASAKENGITKCVVNEDGSVVYTMTKAKHKQMLADFEKSIEESNEGLINGEAKVESFLKIETNDNFSQFDVFVDPQKYTIWDNMNILAFYLQGVYYQCLAGAAIDDIDVVVNFIDNETNEVVETGSYREFMANQVETETNP